MADWDKLLTFVIAPKNGPLRKMVRLRDAQHWAMTPYLAAPGAAVHTSAAGAAAAA